MTVTSVCARVKHIETLLCLVVYALDFQSEIRVRVLVVSVVLFSWTKNLASLFTKVYTISLQIGYLLLGESCDPRGQLLYKHDRDAC